jgi:serine protease Do
MDPVLTAFQRSVAAVAAQVGPAVVGLGRGWARGSGVVVEDGLVLTAAHALRGEDIAVVFADGRAADGRLTAADPDTDVALVAVATPGVAPVTWQPDAVAALAPGAPVLALANPGGHGLRTTFGLVSATGRSFRGPAGRRIPGSIEHTAPLPRGSSGGPLVDPDGRLLGVNAVRREGGLILAVPADARLRERVRALAAGEARPRPQLGVALAAPRAARRLRAAVGLPERDGLLVRAVAGDSPAGRAGLERGDLLVAAAGAPLRDVDALLDALDGAGASLTLRVVRGTEERDVEVALPAAA